MKLPKRRRHIVAVEQPRRKRWTGIGSVRGGGNSSGNGSNGIQRNRMNTIKGSSTIIFIIIKPERSQWQQEYIR
ncbi:Hypothetical protein FKW44_003918, partial [Caligus rogercresseyi]